MAWICWKLIELLDMNDNGWKSLLIIWNLWAFLQFWAFGEHRIWKLGDGGLKDVHVGQAKPGPLVYFFSSRSIKKFQLICVPKNDFFLNAQKLYMFFFFLLVLLFPQADWFNISLIMVFFKWKCIFFNQRGPAAAR